MYVKLFNHGKMCDNDRFYRIPPKGKISTKFVKANETSCGRRGEDAR